jgi:hypothetical protein
MSRIRYCKFCGSTEHDAAARDNAKLDIKACPLVKHRKGSETQIGNGQTCTWIVLPPFHEWHSTKNGIHEYDSHIPRTLSLGTREMLAGVDASRAAPTDVAIAAMVARAADAQETKLHVYTPPKPRKKKEKKSE